MRCLKLVSGQSALALQKKAEFKREVQWTEVKDRLK